jgi:hypothetical protein
MEPRMTDFEDGIQRIVREILRRQMQGVPIVCIQGDCHSGKSELNKRVHNTLNESHRLFGFSGTIREVERYRQDIIDKRTVLLDPRFYLVEDLVSPATFISIYRQFNRLPNLGVQLTRELLCDDDIRSDLEYFHRIIRKNCSEVKEPAFDLILYNPDAKDKVPH